MSTANVSETAERLLTAEEYAALSDETPTELLRGEIVAMPPTGFPHGKVQARIARLLGNFVDEHELGHVLTESGVVTTRNPDSVRGPDVSFYSYDRIPKHEIPGVYATVAPEVVFEVRSPDDRVGNVLKKVGEYLSAGVIQVYVVDPKRRNVVMYGEDDFVTILSESEIAPLPAPLTGWAPRVADFFPE